MKKLDGCTALISGSGRGIGRQIALKLAAEGARVVTNDIDEAPAHETVELIRQNGGEATACAGDVTAPDFGERFVKAGLDTFGSIDIIVNNAGYTWDSVIQKMSDEQIQAMFDVHAIAPIRILRAAAEPIRIAARKEAAEGREVFRKVVNISSMAGTSGNAGQANYSAAKAAMIGLTKTLSKEWGRYKVNVNCVAYGFIETRLTQAVEGAKPKVKLGEREVAVGIPADQLNAIASAIPLGRPGTPQEAADAVYLFCIPESNYISGQIVIAGGGVSF